MALDLTLEVSVTEVMISRIGMCLIFDTFAREDSCIQGFVWQNPVKGAFCTIWS
jgi:hypothetical protein